MIKKVVFTIIGTIVISSLLLCSCDAAMYLDETGTSPSSNNETSTETNTSISLAEVEYSQVSILRAESDSYYHSSSSNMDYTVDYTFDGDISTCWQDGREDEGIGDTLTYYFDEHEIVQVGIVNGNRKNESSYQKNSRLSEVILSFYLDDELVSEQTMSFTDDPSIVETLYELNDVVTCNCIKITIEGVYSGSDYSDTGISEVSFYYSGTVSSVTDSTINTSTSNTSNTSTSNLSPSVTCEYAYVVQFRNSSYPNDSAFNYDLYVLFDIDTEKVYQFSSTSPDFVSVGTYDGSINSNREWSVEVNWDDGDWWHVSGDLTIIEVSDDFGYLFYAERVSSADAQAMVSLS